MSKLMEICETGWELYDAWSALVDKKEKVETKNKDLDRKVGTAWKALKLHIKQCPNCYDPLSEV